jgi:3',5'-cyclic AMP phosphodiesterase CpdA
MGLKIGIIPDIHMRTEYREKISELLEETVEDIRQSNPDLVVAPGDVIQHGEDREEDIENIERVREILDFDCPVRLMGGNHDAYNLTQEDLEESFGNSLWGVKEFEGEKIIFLDTTSPWLSGSRGEVTEDQIEMLKEEQEKEKDFTIFVHHPIHYHDVQDTYWWTNYPERAFCGNKKEINDVLDPEKVKCVINGHVHYNKLTRYEGVEHVTLNAFSKETLEKPVTGTYALAEVGEKVEIEVKVKGEPIRGYTIHP